MIKCNKTIIFSSGWLFVLSCGEGSAGFSQKSRFTKINKFFFENFSVLFCKFKKCIYLCALKQITGLWNKNWFIASCEAATDFKCLVMVCFTE